MIAFADRAESLHRKIEAKCPNEIEVQMTADHATRGNAARFETSPIDRFLADVDILDAYRMWCGKMEPDPRGRREGIMISCPNPAHPDRVPSAWINLDEQVYFCGRCQTGGDKFTIASHHFGLDTKTQFPDLKLRMAESSGYRPARNPVSERHDRGGSGPSDLEPVNWSDAWRRRGIAIDWLLEPVIPARAQVLLYAPRKTGKSLLALEWAAALASGRAILGRPDSEPVDVLVIDFENTLADDVIPRLDALGYASGDLDRLHYYSFPPIKPLDTAEGGQRLEELIVQHQPELVVLDSFARIVAGKENESDTLRDYYRHTATVLKSHGVASIRLDNTGKDVKQGARGSSAKDDDVDLIWQLKQRDSGLRLHREAQRRTSAPENVDLRRIQEPCLQHVLIAASLPAGTKELAALLDRLGIPADASNRIARDALRNEKEAASNELLAAALRYRKLAWTEHGTSAGTATSIPSGTPRGREREIPSYQGGTPNGTPRNAPIRIDGTGGVSLDTPVPMLDEMAAEEVVPTGAPGAVDLVAAA